MSRPITRIENVTVMQSLPRNKSPGPDGFTGGFYQKFRKELTRILLKLFQKIIRRTLVRGNVKGPMWEDSIIKRIMK